MMARGEEGALRRRIWGALVGCALGDAMGMPTEMLSRADIAELFPGGVRGFSPATARDSFGRSLRAGEVTDDTVNTLLVARMLQESAGEVDALRYLDLLRGWMEENPEKSALVAGPSTMRALEAIDCGESPDRSGIFGTTNGAAMKVSPVGVVYSWEDLSALVDAVELLCRPTHNTGVAIACASAAAAAVSYAVRGGQSLDELWDVALAAAEEGSGRGFAFPAASVPARLRLVRALVEGEPGEEVVRQLQDVYGTGMEAVETAPAVLAVVTLAGADPWEAACLAAGLGGDTDTIGAIAACVCGALHPELVPDEAAQTLADVNGIDFEGAADALLPLVRGA